MVPTRIKIVASISKSFPLFVLGLLPVIVGSTLLIWDQADIAAPESIYIILVNFVYIITLIMVLLYTLIKKFNLQRNPDVKSSLYLTLTRAFAFVTIIPSVMLAIIASLGINIGLRGNIANEFVDEMKVAGDAVISYFDIKAAELQNYNSEIALALERIFFFNQDISEGELRKAFQDLQSDFRIGKSFIIDSDCNIVARGVNSYLFDFTDPPTNFLRELPTLDQQNLSLSNCGEILDRNSFSNLEYIVWNQRNSPKGIIYQLPNSSQLHSVTHLRYSNNYFLFVSTELIQTLVDLQKSISEESTIITGEVPQLIETLLNYSIILLAGGALLIFIVVPQGLLFANRINKPVKNLAIAARKIGEGDLKTKFSTEGSDEIALFSRIFKEMVEKLDHSINREISIRMLAESREREFREVLSNISSGVIGLDVQHNVIFINNFAIEKLNLGGNLPRNAPISFLYTQPLSQLVPEFVPIVDELYQSHDKTIDRKLEFAHDNYVRSLLIKAAKRFDKNGEPEGYVIAFDDISDLVNAEQKSAWASAAQQIAHEIKNAFTPVSGALDLLRDNINTKIKEAKIQQMEKYVDIVEESMHGLLRISQEFSEFAKLPEPTLELANIVKVCESARDNELHRGENMSILIENNLKSNMLLFDWDLMRQVMVNLLKNAREGINARMKLNPKDPIAPLIKIVLEETEGEVLINVLDNGIGFSRNLKMSEYKKPFVTFNKENGSGLGLAFTDRIIDGHDGRITLGHASPFGDDSHSGAHIIIHLPNLTHKLT
ncbi:MAG: HAMP domain-containing protein [Rhodobacteraceae bacterium]|nr:HAMP domain-containing protein [Paracoccaceae bacterium]